ncbi:SUMF1/EgtB/PvdO family nonheme iron enzyme [Gimesia chilikensis]|uniref:Serine/threonine-protein kinase pkn1 n=1 Tax=Gimesia chilikensis TaxID=2605989 RepID=A0A517PRR1_9PLAN|nr:SUMF1/EgtB/PvdO family nonheme iron enzyme [Gimesia chilikensis]QDT22063.1 Serine/threonine-protein kinase pkn1 [Gimesia chilikensis]
MAFPAGYRLGSNVPRYRFGLLVILLLFAGSVGCSDPQPPSSPVAENSTEASETTQAETDPLIPQTEQSTPVAPAEPTTSRPPENMPVKRLEPEKVEPPASAPASTTAASTERRQASPLNAPFNESMAKQGQADWAASLNREPQITNSIGMQLTLIPPGEFTMGSPTTEAERQDFETPHRVTLTRPFYLGTYEVTQAEYQTIMGENPSWFSANGKGKDKVAGKKTERFPVEFTNWEDAQRFCRKLSDREGKTYRLPTEAEWEYACRAGTTSAFHYGIIDNGQAANTHGDVPYGTNSKGPALGRTTEVGSYAPNAFGLHDMHGNVFEWCADWFVLQLYKQRAGKVTVDPLVSKRTPAAKTRVLRGGSWTKGKGIHARAALRRGNLPDWKGQNIGFRVVQEISGEPRPAPVVQAEPMPADPKPSDTKEKPVAATIRDPRAGDLVYIQPGKFLMGSLESEPGSWPMERPQHEVEIKQGFYIGKYEVTHQQFSNFVAKTKYKTDAEKSEKGGGGYVKEQKGIVNWNPRFFWKDPGFPQKSNSPVVNISWNDAVAFCDWLTEQDGQYRFRLPTEAEWEYCGRAGTKAAYAWGDKQESMVGNENASDQSLARLLSDKSFHKSRCGKWDDGIPFTTPVGSFKANPFGLYDMQGNVSEWCSDVYLDNSYQLSPDQIPATGKKRVLRGGAFDYLPMDCRVARRLGDWANETRCDRGFRVVRELTPQPGKTELAEAPQNPAPVEPQPATQNFDRPVIRFGRLATPEPVTSFTVSEDNKFLICSHQGANQVSIWDAQTLLPIKILSTPSPRSVLSRGPLLMVANDGKGTVSVFSSKDQWAQTNQLDVEKPHIVYLSAPQGRHFQNEILVTCHGEGPKASYSDCHVYHLDLKTDKDRHLMKAALATCSFDGKYVITQGSFNLSPSGGISAFAWEDFVSDRPAQPIYKGGAKSQTPYVYQVYPGSFWIGNNVIFGGVPLVSVRSKLDNLVIADRNRKLLYALTPHEVKVYPVSAVIEEVEDRKAEFPLQEFSHVYHRHNRISGYLLDHPIAFTENELTHLFALDMGKNQLLVATTPAFDIPDDALAPRLVTEAPSAGNPGSGKSDAPTKQAVPNPLKFPAFLAEGESFTHTLPEQPETKYELLNAPTGVKLNPQNEVTWKPGSRQVGKHELKFKVTQGDKVTFARVEVEVVSRDLIEMLGGLDKLKDFPRFDLDPEPAKLIPAPDYQSFLVLQGKKVHRMTGDGIKDVKTFDLPERYEFIAERDDTFLALDQGRFQLDVIDQRGGRIKKSIPLDRAGVRVLEITDLAVHPKYNISYVAIKTGIEVPRYRVLVVNESTSRVVAPDELLGTWVCVDASGKMLYTGYRDIYRNGTKFHINPGWRLLEVPQYGNLDFLISFKLRRGVPSIYQYIDNAGGNGNGIRLSADGKRITYLSNGGFPSLSRNLAGWNAKQLKQNPVAYETKGRGVCTQIAFHPTLDLVAVPGGNSAVFFNRETGEVIEDKLLLLNQGLGDVKVADLTFSPDGKSLIFLCHNPLQGNYLRPVPLKLTPAEQKQVGRKINLAQEKPRPVPTVKQSELQALKLDPKPNKQTPRQIAERFNPTVVLIKSETGSGTGFVVGSEGYILTCAHAAPEDEKLIVEYQAGKGPVKSVEATILLWDEDQDLALLKLKEKVDLPTVILSSRKSYDSGEQLTVIGNPGLGETILSQTLTTGVISNPKRMLRDQPLIQISAAVNPGNSGGPVFDDRGQVIGLVILKGDIEAAGFAVPSTELRKFLLSVTKGKPEAGDR